MAYEDGKNSAVLTWKNSARYSAVSYLAWKQNYHFQKNGNFANFMV